ncbi:MAG: SIMPL domain-containing protein [Burkholderiales bacterium]|nr:SIMPL domain-containing protein [Burkholderiales bacterium]
MSAMASLSRSIVRTLLLATALWASPAPCADSGAAMLVPGAALRAPHVEVTADADLEVPPDRALLDLGVSTRADTAAAAAKQNSARMEAVLAAVRKALGAKARLSIGSYHLSPVYGPTPRDGEPARVVAYQAINIVKLETAELTRLGEVIDIAIAAGANQVQRVAFTLADPDAARSRALRDAVVKAQQKAATIAAALNVKLGQVASVVEQDMPPVRPFVREAAMARADVTASTPIEAGPVTVRARVVMTVQIER